MAMLVLASSFATHCSDISRDGTQTVSCMSALKADLMLGPQDNAVAGAHASSGLRLGTSPAPACQIAHGPAGDSPVQQLGKADRVAFLAVLM
jgi:hypothetical protein